MLEYLTVFRQVIFESLTVFLQGKFESLTVFLQVISEIANGISSLTVIANGISAGDTRDDHVVRAAVGDRLHPKPRSIHHKSMSLKYEPSSEPGDIRDDGVVGAAAGEHRHPPPHRLNPTPKTVKDHYLKVKAIIWP